MTLGMMMSVQYIIGQLQQPFSAFVGLIQSIQDVKISLERLGEVTNKDDEESNDSLSVEFVPKEQEIVLDNVIFQYEGKRSEKVLDGLNATVPFGKMTAIVGVSGSGKTTLLKLLLKFYEPTHGAIKYGDVNLQNVRNSVWRELFGAVMQDGYIFNDTISKNIALSNENPDILKLRQAAAYANISEFIEALPLNYRTK